jgi:hypothetical protein
MINIKKLLAIALIATLAYGLAIKIPHHDKTHLYIHEVNKVCQCPPDYPYDNGIDCLKCDWPGYWNFTSKKC